MNADLQVGTQFEKLTFYKLINVFNIEQFEILPIISFTHKPTTDIFKLFFVNKCMYWQKTNIVNSIINKYKNFKMKWQLIIDKS